MKNRKGDFTGAIEDATRALEIDPKTVDAWYNRAEAKSNLSDVEGAIGDATQSLRLNPSQPAALHLRASMRLRGGDYEGARADFGKTIELEPRFAPAYCSRSTAALCLGDLAAATADAEKAIELGPVMAQAYGVRARVKMVKGDAKGALADCDKGVESEPNDAGAYFTRASMREERRDWAGALEDYRESIRKDRSVADYAQFHIFLIRVRQGEGEAAKASLSEYVKDRPSRPGTEWETRILAFLSGELKLSDFLALAPESSVARRCEGYYYAGIFELISGDRTEGAGLLKKCVDVGQKSFYEHWNAAAELEALKAGK